MIPKPGSNLISYQELTETREGLALWNTYMAQVTEIALQYPHHFFSRAARVIMMEDARRHQFYAYLGDERMIDAFCIAALSCDQAELLWAASHKDRRGRMSELYRYIERRLFTEDAQASKIYGMCCTEDSRCENEEGEVIDGSLWSHAHRFHEVMGYRFSYRLEDYWGEGSHAFVFMKLREPRRYGYTKREGFTFRSGPRQTLRDSQPALNQQLQKTIVPYLDVFDETFLRSFPPEKQKSSISADSMKGFTGLALFDCVKNTATLFAKTSAEPEPEASRLEDMKFEYDTDASALTQMLASESIQDDIGILHYPAIWDNDSEISILSYCERFYPSLQHQSGFTVFYARRTGIGGHKSVLYFVTPEIENVVWYKPLWRAFAKYSFALILEIYSYFSSLLVLNDYLRNNQYFHDLIQAVSPAEVPGSGDDFLSKIARMKDAIQERIDAHYWAVVRSKESAIAHYGHTLGHRLSPIQAFFEGNKESLKRAKANATFLDDLSIVLQSRNLSSTEDLYCHAKKTRFIEYEREGAPLNIAWKIREEWPLLAESYQLIRVSAELSQVRIMTLLEFTGGLQDAHLAFMLVDSENGEACRPREAFYSQLFSELLLNVVRYGGIPKNKIDLQEKTASVPVSLTAQMLKHESEVVPSPCPAMTLSNKVGDKAPPGWLRKTQWTPWPSDRENDGPGMAIAILRRLGLGELWYRYNPTKRMFRVAVWLRGLSLGEESPR